MSDLGSRRRSDRRLAAYGCRSLDHGGCDAGLCEPAHSGSSPAHDRESRSGERRNADVRTVNLG